MVIIKSVASIFNPITTFTTSLTPVNLTTPLWELTIKKLIIVAINTKGNCSKKLRKPNVISKLYLIMYAKKKVKSTIHESNNSTSHFEAYLSVNFRNIELYLLKI